MCKRGFVFREGIIDINTIKSYAEKRKAGFIDLRRIGFTNIKQLNILLSRYLSYMSKRPARTSTKHFFDGVHKDKPFFAVLPHNFLNELTVFNHDRKLTIELTEKLLKNEKSCIGLMKRMRH